MRSPEKRVLLMGMVLCPYHVLKYQILHFRQLSWKLIPTMHWPWIGRGISRLFSTEVQAYGA